MVGVAKKLVRNKLIDFQKKIADISFLLTSQQNEHNQREKELNLELFDILDSFENTFNLIQEKESSWEKSAQMSMKTFRSIYKKLLRVLFERGVEQIEFPANKAVIGLCKVVETRVMPGIENEYILSVVKKGYKKRTGEVIRPAEVVTVLNLPLR
ncbi:MAG: nucleotide exchange factor GrpE [bacterium]